MKFRNMLTLDNFKRKFSNCSFQKLWHDLHARKARNRSNINLTRADVYLTKLAKPIGLYSCFDY